MISADRDRRLDDYLACLPLTSDWRLGPRPASCGESGSEALITVQ